MTTAVLHGNDGGNPLIMDTAVYRSMNSAQGWGGTPHNRQSRCADQGTWHRNLNRDPKKYIIGPKGMWTLLQMSPVKGIVHTTSKTS